MILLIFRFLRFFRLRNIKSILSNIHLGLFISKLLRHSSILLILSNLLCCVCPKGIFPDRRVRCWAVVVGLVGVGGLVADLLAEICEIILRLILRLIILRSNFRSGITISIQIKRRPRSNSFLNLFLFLLRSISILFFRIRWLCFFTTLTFTYSLGGLTCANYISFYFIIDSYLRTRLLRLLRTPLFIPLITSINPVSSLIRRLQFILICKMLIIFIFWWFDPSFRRQWIVLPSVHIRWWKRWLKNGVF